LALKVLVQQLRDLALHVQRRLHYEPKMFDATSLLFFATKKLKSKRQQNILCFFLSNSKRILKDKKGVARPRKAV
jgi:hypothetical protein